MTDAMSRYIGGGTRHLSPQVIQTMKKNMKKVPIVQKKSENYHRHEEQEAEKIIEEQLQNNDEGMIMTETQTENNGGQKNENVFKKIVNYLKRYVKDFYNIKQKYNG